MHEIFLHKITLGLIPADHALEDSRFRDLITWISIKLLDLLIGRNYLVQTRSIALVSKFCTFVSLDALLFFYFWDTIPEDIFLNADMISSNFSLLKKNIFQLKSAASDPVNSGEITLAVRNLMGTDISSDQYDWLFSVRLIYRNFKMVCTSNKVGHFY